MVEKDQGQRLRPSQRRTRSRQQQENRRQRGMFLVGVAAILLILAIPAYGYYDNIFSPPRETVVRVNDTTFDLGYLVKIMRMLQGGGVTGTQDQSLGSLPFQVVQTLADNELIRQAAPRENITVTSQEVDQEVRQRILGNVEEEETPADQLEREFQERYRRYLTQIKISENDHRQIVLNDLYRERLRELLGQSVASVLPHAHLYTLPLTASDSDEVADEVRTQFARGESFESLLEQFVTNPDTVRRGGEVGWVPQGAFPELDSLIFEDLEVGQLSDPILDFDPSSGEGVTTFYLVTERAEARALEDQYREVLKSRSLQEWLNRERAANDVRIPFDSDQYSWVIEQLQKSSGR